MTTKLPHPIREFAVEVLALASAVAEAERVQWSPSLTPRPREDTTERSKGGHSDPTSTIVTDERRLALREEVVAAGRRIEAATREITEHRERVERALAAWAGARP